MLGSRVLSVLCVTAKKQGFGNCNVSLLRPAHRQWWCGSPTQSHSPQRQRHKITMACPWNAVVCSVSNKSSIKEPHQTEILLMTRAAMFNRCGTRICKTCDTWLVSQGHWPLFFKSLPKDVFIDFREKTRSEGERERERETETERDRERQRLKERNTDVREKYLLDASRTHPDWDQTHNLTVYWTTLRPTEPSGQGRGRPLFP